MSICCNSLKESFKNGFCHIRALRGDDSEGGIRFGIAMGVGGVEMTYCPFCGKRMEVVLKEVRE